MHFNVSILPGRLSADGPEKGADGEEDGFEDEAERNKEAFYYLSKFVRGA
jgi:hypothetical protein